MNTLNKTVIYCLKGVTVNICIAVGLVLLATVYELVTFTKLTMDVGYALMFACIVLPIYLWPVTAAILALIDHIRKNKERK